MKRLPIAILLLVVLAGPVRFLQAAVPSKASLEAARKAVDEFLSPSQRTSGPVGSLTWPQNSVERVEKIDWMGQELIAAGVSRRRGAYEEALDLAAFQALTAARLSAYQRLLVLAVDERRSLGDLIREHPHLGKLVEDILSRTAARDRGVDAFGLVRVSIRLSLKAIMDFLVPLMYPAPKDAPPPATEVGVPPSITIRVFAGSSSYRPSLLPSLRGLGAEASSKVKRAMGGYLRTGARPSYQESARSFGRCQDFVARSLGGLHDSTIHLDDGDALALARLLEGHGASQQVSLQILPGSPPRKTGASNETPAASKLR